MDIDLLQLMARWQDIGYEFENVVEIPGAMSRRGGIRDIFSPDNEFPARIEFVGNRVESIRLFDPKTQRSLKLAASVTVVPARESLQYVDGDCSVDYLHEKTLLITDDLDELKTVVNKLHSEVEELNQEKPEPVKPLNLPILSWGEFETKVNRTGKHLELISWNTGYSDKSCLQFLSMAVMPSYGGRLEAFCERLQEMLREKQR